MSYKAIVFDAEADGFLEQATKAWCIAALDIDTNEMFEFGPRSIDKGLSFIKEADCIIGHNIIDYDLRLFKKLYGWKVRPTQTVLDTVILSRMLYPKRPPPEEKYTKASHSLEAWGIRLGKYKQEHEDWTKYSEDMRKRCKSDVELNALVLEELRNEAGFEKDFYKQIDITRCVNP